MASGLILWTSSTVLGAGPDHEGEPAAEAGDSSQRVRTATAAIVQAKPSPAALSQIFKDLQGESNLSTEKFSKIVDKVTGLDDTQRATLKDTFKKLETEAKKAEGRPRDEFLNAMGGAMAESLPPTAPPATAANAEGDAKNAGAENGKGGDQAKNGESKDPLKAIQEALKGIQDNKGKAPGDPLKDAAQAKALQDLIAGNKGNEGAGNGNGGGGNGGGGDKGGGGGGNPQPPQNNDNKAGDLAKNLHDLAKNDRNRDRDRGRGATNNSSSSSSDDKKKEEEKKPSISTASAKDSTSDLLNELTKNKKKETSPSPSPDAFGGLTGAASGLPDTATPGGSKLKIGGKKSSLSPIQGGFAFNPPGGFGGFGGDAGSDAGGGLAGAKIQGGGGGNGGGGGGGMDLAGMKFEQGDGYFGPNGNVQFSKGGIYAESGGAATVGTDDSGMIADAVDAIATANRRSTYGSSQVMMPTQEGPRRGGILDQYIGTQLTNVCRTTNPGQVGVCSGRPVKFKRLENISQNPKFMNSGELNG